MSSSYADALPLPLVVHIGFAGSRNLMDLAQHPKTREADFLNHVVDWLVKRLEQMRAELGMQANHYFCGVSALAIGGDTVFSYACKRLGIAHRVLLPQTRDEFLSACENAEPDFGTIRQREEATELLDSPHVIEERVVTEARLRQDRFDDTNREIVRMSDVVVCLIRAGSSGRPGGTEDFIACAALRHKPVLLVTVAVAGGMPAFSEEWRLPAIEGECGSSPEDAFEPPSLPTTLAGASLPPQVAGTPASWVSRYTDAIVACADPAAKARRVKFVSMAVAIIGAHVIATVMAAAAVSSHFVQNHIHVLLFVLGAELILLAVGMLVHRRLHKSHVAQIWAEARLLAEVARSVQAMGDLHVHLRHLFDLPFPESFRSVLRTINVEHLRATRGSTVPWQTQRDIYVTERLSGGESSQIPYFGERAARYGRLLKRTQIAFHCFWFAAFSATSLKLILHTPLESMVELGGSLAIFAIVMPVLAAGSLSFAAALDLDAQKHNFDQIQTFLTKQRIRLLNARSPGDYRDLVVETETRLLGEVANWFARRSFVNVT